MATRPPSERGAALLSVLVSVAVLTAMAANLAYESRVSLRLAANARDELRAEYQARSGVAFSRLVLSFQQQLDDQMQGGGGPTALPVPRIQLWRAVPVDSTIVAGLFGGGGGLFSAPAATAPTPPPSAGAASGATARPPAGGTPNARAAAGTAPAPAAAAAADRPPPPEGGPRLAGGPPGFDARIEDESTKVNAQLETGGTGGNAGILAAQVLALYQLSCDSRWDPLFDREDATGNKTNRGELLEHLRDWVDEDNQGAHVRADWGTASCSMVPQLPAFETAFGDENAVYDRGSGDDRYKAKNARMDSLDELYLVAGVSDAFMAAFGDRLTVYLPREAKWNVNDLDPKALMLRAAAMRDPSVPLAMLLDPTLPEKIQAILMKQTMGGILSISPQQLGMALEAVGIKVNQGLLTGTNTPFTDRSSTYSIRSTGTAGDVKTTIEAIVRLDSTKDAQAQAQAQGQGAPGRVIHWREE
jgi:general secretion pathway protein K